MNKVILMGRLARDPILRNTQTSNIAQCSFTVAVDRPGKSADGTTKADFISCVAWRQTAEFISKYFVKGNRILLSGSIQTRDYQDKEDPNKRVYVTEVVVDNVEFCDSKGSQSGAQTIAAPASNGSKTTEEAPADGYFPIDNNDYVPF